MFLTVTQPAPSPPKCL